MSIPFDPSDSHPDFDHLLAPLKDIANAINAESDDLSDRILALEKSLNALNLGVNAWCEQPFHREPNLDVNDQEIGTSRMTLGYHRFDDGWALAVSYSRFEDDDDLEIGKLKDAKRWAKVKAYHDVPELINELMRAGNRVLEMIRESKKAGAVRLIGGT